MVEPDILILDEVLSVGDVKFRKKSEKRIKQMFKKGTTVLFVSHNLNQIRSLCTRAIWLENGHVVEDGPVEEVTEHFEKKVAK